MYVYLFSYVSIHTSSTDTDKCNINNIHIVQSSDGISKVRDILKYDVRGCCVVYLLIPVIPATFRKVRR